MDLTLFIVKWNKMPRIQCILCCLWFASELGLKIHYSKMHALVWKCNWKRKAKCNHNNEYLNNNMLFELCEASGESRKEEKEFMVKNVKNDITGLEVVEGTLWKAEEKDNF